jgi:hypothetical protein
VLDLTLELLPAMTDDLAADVCEQLSVAILDREEELRAVRSVLSASLAFSHEQHLEIVRLRRRLAELLDAQRRQPKAAA